MVDIEVRWPDGSVSTRENIAADQLLTITQDSTNTRLVVNQGDGDGVYDPGTEVVVSAAEAAEAEEHRPSRCVARQRRRPGQTAW